MTATVLCPADGHRPHTFLRGAEAIERAPEARLGSLIRWIDSVDQTSDCGHDAGAAVILKTTLRLC
jgi:hypothetical protein